MIKNKRKWANYLNAVKGFGSLLEEGRRRLGKEGSGLGIEDESDKIDFLFG